MVASKSMHAGLAAVFGLISSASADIIFQNHCGYPVYVSQTHNGARCNYGPGDGPHESRCIRDGNPFWTMWPGQSAQIPWNTGVGSNLKLHREPWDGAPVLQFEYTRADPSVPDHLAYNFSDIDGAGPGAVGSPFRDGNVRATPVGPGVGWDTCNVLTCPANQACPDSYQYPSDNSKMHTCPVSVETVYIDLCMPDHMFWQRDVPFTA